MIFHDDWMYVQTWAQVEGERQIEITGKDLPWRRL